MNPSHHRTPRPTSWRSLAAAYLLLAAFPLVLWAISHPWIAAAATVVVAVLLAGRPLVGTAVADAVSRAVSAPPASTGRRHRRPSREGDD